jgi:hypothetical protein
VRDENENKSAASGLADLAGSIPFDPAIPIGRAFGLLFMFDAPPGCIGPDSRGFILDCKSKAEAKREGKAIAARRNWRLRDVFKVKDADDYNNLIIGGYREKIQSNNKD